MVKLTKDQNKIGQVLDEGNHVLSSTEIRLNSREEQDVKDKMTELNRRWTSLRSKSLDRQAKFVENVRENFDFVFV